MSFPDHPFFFKVDQEIQVNFTVKNFFFENKINAKHEKVVEKKEKEDNK